MLGSRECHLEAEWDWGSKNKDKNIDVKGIVNR